MAEVVVRENCCLLFLSGTANLKQTKIAATLRYAVLSTQYFTLLLPFAPTALVFPCSRLLLRL